MDRKIFVELRELIDDALLTRELPSPEVLKYQIRNFTELFGPKVLSGLDGEALLKHMHWRQDQEFRSLVYWLEYKNDEEFGTFHFGNIGGGSAMKFGLFQRQQDGAWGGGSPNAPRVLSTKEAVALAREQRDELLAGCDVLSSLRRSDMTDDAYTSLQMALQDVAPRLCHVGWAHKYWFLSHPDRLDTFHDPSLQRFHLVKLLELPPDRLGSKQAGTPRFNCAGRFVNLARELDVPVATLCQALSRRSGAIHRYWKVGTTEGSAGESRWEEMREGRFVAIGWRDDIPDLTDLLTLGKGVAKDQLYRWLLRGYGDAEGLAKRKAGEIWNFAAGMAEPDLVVACEGQTVLGIGRVCGPYEYDAHTAGFPHKRPVEWLSLGRWQLPEGEGPRTTVYEIGKAAENLIGIETKVAGRRLPATHSRPLPEAEKKPAPLPPLSEDVARVESVLRRKGQVVLYGPPGTGKTHLALKAARELAARQAFQKPYASLDSAERLKLEGPKGRVRVCTFHPGMGYEDFVEGLRPSAANGQLLFLPRDGIFKELCTDARNDPEAAYFLLVDEINRGDLPRIFGELMTVIEHDKRGQQVILPVTQDFFSVPRNVFLIGTMNTADRSISLLDAALRRRFGFIELMPDSSRLAGRVVGSLSLSAWLDALNARLRKYLERDARNLQIGHAYLMSPQPPASPSEFARVLRDDIIPLLEEYCYDDFSTLAKILGRQLVDADAGRIREELFAPRREDELVQAVAFEEMQEYLPSRTEEETGDGAEELEDDSDAT